jgi:SPP1 gp7 family putative phage head morphogenesis protein
MLLAFVRRYKQQKVALGIELAFSREVAKIAKQLDLDIPGIRRSFRTNARKRVTESIRFIERKVNDAISDVTQKQQTTANMTKQLRRRLNDMGMTPARPSLVETLVRTHSQVAFNAAQYQLEQDDPEGLITGWQYVTVGDDRVRDEHAEMDGVIFAVDDPRLDEWWPPNGWNCRCQLVSLTDPVEPTKTPKGIAPDEGFDFNPGRLL